MSVVSKNPFELLGDGDEDRAPSPAPKAAGAASAAKTAPAAQQPKVVPGAAAKGGRGARYPARGGPRNVYREERPAAEGGEEGFEGERVAPPKKDHQGRDRHTKGPREDRTHTGARSKAPGAAGARGPKGGQAGRGPRGGAGAAAEKKAGAAPAETYGNEEGKEALNAANEGEKDAGAEAATPAPVAEEAEEEQEPEDTSKTLDQYLAEKAEKALGGALAKKEARQVSEDKAQGKALEREEMDSFFSGKTKSTTTKEKAPKKEKVYIEVDGQFSTPAGRPARGASDRPARGRGAPRGGPRGGARGGARPPRAATAAVDAKDEKAFPALGA